MRTPVALIIFNRPDTTARVVEAIAQARPPKLFVIADGPRPDHLDDVVKCTAARAVIDLIHWDCEVLKNYSDVNLGCGLGPATAISWVFDQVEKAIILEDDCLPHPTFFQFCDELLERYRDDERVMQISGNNFQLSKSRVPYSVPNSYFFSYFNLTWGWATWRRAWRYFDLAVPLWPALRKTSLLRDIVEDPRAIAYWHTKFDQAYAAEGNIDYWDYQWTLACWTQNGLSIVPNRNLVVNIGLGHHDATHTLEEDKEAARRPQGMTFPLQHPAHVRRILEADRFFISHVVVPHLQPSRPSWYNLTQKWANLVGEHPSLRSPVTFSRKLGQISHKYLSSLVHPHHHN